MSLHSERRLKKCCRSSWVSSSSGELCFANVLFLNDTVSLLLTLPTLRRCTTLEINPHLITQTHHQNVYLQGQQGVAVAVCAKHVLFYPGFRPQWSSRTWELGWSDDVTRKGLLQGWGMADRPRHTHPAPSAVVPAPGHPPGTPAIALVAAPGRRFHHGLRRYGREEGHTERKGKHGSWTKTLPCMAYDFCHFIRSFCSPDHSWAWSAPAEAG